jgi:hypothetical protein
MNNRNSIKIASTYGLSENNIPSNIFISLKNIPNGGMPEIAKNARRNSQPVLGIRFNTEATCSTSRDL